MTLLHTYTSIIARRICRPENSCQRVKPNPGLGRRSGTTLSSVSMSLGVAVPSCTAPPPHSSQGSEQGHKNLLVQRQLDGASRHRGTAIPQAWGIPKELWPQQPANQVLQKSLR